MTDADDDVVFEPDADDAGDEAALRAKLVKLRAELSAARKEKEEHLTGWQRAKADYVNLKKRSEEERALYAARAVEAVAASLLPVLDSLDHALARPPDASAEGERRGLENIRAQFLSALKENGVVSFSPEGEPFDPNRHEPMGTVATDNESQDNVVLEVLQRGYRMGERVIRPARVKVGHFGNGQ
jgi:molecular chaperone GrpE (heat shock protein)